MADNLNSYAQKTRTRLVIAFLVILFTVGLGLIWIIYGSRAAFLGLICLLGMVVPIGLITIILYGLSKFVDKK